ncbi:protein insensitive [Drosophila mojavensis]|uniref:BEN domain-containing protein n=1 Tax=Drosophila mojavensis TaxID=7230 RepID=B4KL45_DROMO|nr:protein insensitive [Drosophila mojavensis]EDW12795.1 uncharacterized protein Dmoj_GI17866 [Drosophila mojavensis]
MSAISRATQTESSDRLAAVQLRLENLKSILPQHDVAWAECQEVQRSPTTIAKSGSTQIKRDRSTVPIGHYRTRVARSVYKNLNWDSYSLATRALLDAVFDKETLGTKNLSGIKIDSKGRQWSATNMLDPQKISDIVQLVKRNCKVDERRIRKIIAHKCGDTASTKRIKSL